MNTLNSYAPVALRVGLSLLLLWFGAEQLLHGMDWVSLVPGWAVSLSGMSPAYIVIINGAFETVAGVLLAFGILTRWVALIIAIHTFVIAFDIGISALGMRDVAIAFSALALSLNGKDEWSIYCCDFSPAGMSSLLDMPAALPILRICQ